MPSTILGDTRDTTKQDVFEPNAGGDGEPSEGSDNSQKSDEDVIPSPQQISEILLVVESIHNELKMFTSDFE